ncbi:MAG: GNAT family N-acetyltransferase [Saprospiraceae bacterium]|nr:GNAT family N-acetyltransferase [Saprospiraceae bacterium]
MDILVRQYEEKDAGDFLSMALDLWSDYDRQELNDLIAEARQKQFQILVAANKHDLIGFAMFSIREDYVEGASSSPTGYLEGIYVKPAFRKYGVARTLYEDGEKWVLSHGCIEIGSDTWTWNKGSQKFHVALGFKEEEILVHFIKEIESVKSKNH